MSHAADSLFSTPAPMRIGPRTFAWGERTFVMGIVNVTPDSFSGDGLLTGHSADVVAAAVAQSRTMAAEGADLLDVGGESTRPGHLEVAEDEELRRVVPVIAAIRQALPEMPISVDTTKPAVAEAALAAGADLINDVWAVAPDDSLARVAAAHAAPLVLMHNRAEPRYQNLVAEVIADLHAAIGPSARVWPASSSSSIRASASERRPITTSRFSRHSASCACSDGRFCSARRASRRWAGSSTCRRTSASRRPWRPPLSGSQPGPTSFASTMSAPTFASPEPQMRSSGGPGDPANLSKEAQPERPDRPDQHAVPGPARLLRP